MSSARELTPGWQQEWLAAKKLTDVDEKGTYVSLLDILKFWIIIITV